MITTKKKNDLWIRNYVYYHWYIQDSIRKGFVISEKKGVNFFKSFVWQEEFFANSWIIYLINQRSRNYFCYNKSTVTVTKLQTATKIIQWRSHSSSRLKNSTAKVTQIHSAAKKLNTNLLASIIRQMHFWYNLTYIVYFVTPFRN